MTLTVQKCVSSLNIRFSSVSLFFPIADQARAPCTFANSDRHITLQYQESILVLKTSKQATTPTAAPGRSGALQLYGDAARERVIISPYCLVQVHQFVAEWAAEKKPIRIWTSLELPGPARSWYCHVGLRTMSRAAFSTGGSRVGRSCWRSNLAREYRRHGSMVQE